MAVKEKNEEFIENAAPKRAEEDRVDLTIPPVKSIDEENYLFVGLNGKSYQIKKGVTINMPRAVAEIIVNSIEAENEAIEAKRKMHEVKEVLI